MKPSTRMVIQGNWEEFKGKVKKSWGDMTDDDLRTLEGGTQELVGRIQKRTGQGAQEIERRLDELAQES